MDINRNGPILLPNNCKHLNPPYFSFPTTFKRLFFLHPFLHTIFAMFSSLQNPSFWLRNCFLLRTSPHSLLKNLWHLFYANCFCQENILPIDTSLHITHMFNQGVRSRRGGGGPSFSSGHKHEYTLFLFTFHTVKSHRGPTQNIRREPNKWSVSLIEHSAT
jgi:hypothetical protein